VAGELLLRKDIARGLSVVTVWTLNRPEVRNALSMQLLAQIKDAARSVPTTSRAVILEGSGAAFAAGGDLKELEDKLSAEDARALRSAGYDACEALRELAVPVIAAVAGPAIGGGAELALAADFRVMTDAAYLSFRHARLGVTTAWGSLKRLRAALPGPVASELLMTGRSVYGPEAQALGLAQRTKESATEAALKLATEISKSSPEAVASYKHMLRSLEEPRADQLEEASFVKLWPSEEHQVRMLTAINRG
jgi:enoyl-CoA hydratase/carnithine racemase